MSSRPGGASGPQAEMDWAPQEDVLGQGRGRWRATKHSPESRELVNGTRAEASRLRKPAEWAGAVVAVGQVAKVDPGPGAVPVSLSTACTSGRIEGPPDPQQAA